MREMSIMVDDTVYETLQPLVKQQKIESYLVELAKLHADDSSYLRDAGHQKSVDEAFGSLHKYAKPEKIEGEKGAWERNVVERYAKDRF